MDIINTFRQYLLTKNEEDLISIKVLYQFDYEVIKNGGIKDTLANIFKAVEQQPNFYESYMLYRKYKEYSTIEEVKQVISMITNRFVTDDKIIDVIDMNEKTLLYDLLGYIHYKIELYLSNVLIYRSKVTVIISGIIDNLNATSIPLNSICKYLESNKYNFDRSIQQWNMYIKEVHDPLNMIIADLLKAVLAINILNNNPILASMKLKIYLEQYALHMINKILDIQCSLHVIINQFSEAIKNSDIEEIKKHCNPKI